MRLPLALILLFSLLCCNCTKSRYQNMLKDIDTVIVNEYYDSALSMIRDIPSIQLTDKEKAYYYLLKTKLLFRMGVTIATDSMIDYSIGYYTENKENSKLAESYYLKGWLNKNRKNIKQGYLCFKEAEKILLSTKDDILEARTYQQLSICYYETREYAKSLLYEKKALSLAQKGKDTSLQMYCLNNMTACYGNMDMIDSAIYCTKQIIPLIQKLNGKKKSVALQGIAACYEFIDIDKSEEYARMALKIEERPNIYQLLASIYLKRGDTVIAENYWNKAVGLCGDNLLRKESILTDMNNFYSKTNNLEGISNTSSALLEVRDSIYKKINNDSIKENQLIFEMQENERLLNQKIKRGNITIWGIVCLVLVIITYTLFKFAKHSRIINELKSKEGSLMKAIENEQAKTVIVKKGSDNKSKEISLLKTKLKDAENQISISAKEKEEQLIMMNAKGSVLYKEIMDNKNVSCWDNNDYNSFFCHIKFFKPEIAEVISNDYHEIPPRLQLQLILTLIGKSNEEIANILAISPSTIRVNKYRIKYYKK